MAYPAQEPEDDIPVAVVVGPAEPPINPFLSPAAAESARMRQEATKDI